MNAVVLSVALPEEDVRKLSEFILAQCRLDRNAALEEAAVVADEYDGPLQEDYYGQHKRDIADAIRALKERP